MLTVSSSRFGAFLHSLEGYNGAERSIWRSNRNTALKDFEEAKLSMWRSRYNDIYNLPLARVCSANKAPSEQGEQRQKTGTSNHLDIILYPNSERALHKIQIANYPLSYPPAAFVLVVGATTPSEGRLYASI